jgi:hypothetical protein
MYIQSISPFHRYTATFHVDFKRGINKRYTDTTKTFVLYLYLRIVQQFEILGMALAASGKNRYSQAVQVSSPAA